MFLMQPLGSLASGCLQDALGRRTCMLLLNAPHLAAWYLLHSAESATRLYAASLAMGFGMGCLDAPLLSYIGEAAEPRIRGTLTALAFTSVAVGHLLEYSVGCAFRSWRHVMLVSCSVPVVAALALSQIPESPVWLLTKGKKSEAMSALKWLRGWASDDEVIDEFHSLESYCETSKNEYRNQKQTKIGKQSATYAGVPDGGHDTPAGEPSIVDIFAGALSCACLLRRVGKRTLALASTTSCTMCCLSLGAYTYAMHWYNVPSVPLSLFCVLYFSMSLGINAVPWLLISEVFPTRGRGMASGVCAAAFYAIAFLVSKTWLNLHGLIGLHGCFLLYGAIGVLGVAFVFVCVPETEGKTLAEIETFFASKTAGRPIAVNG